MPEPIFKGVIVPLITPFNEDYSIDFNGLNWIVNYVIERGVNGIFPYSTTGEFVHLKPREGIEIVKHVLENAHGAVKIIPGISANTTIESIELGKEMEDLGVDGVITTPPFFFKLKEKHLEYHFSTIARKVDLPIIIYNIPSLTGNPIPVHIYAKLAKEFSNIVGAKVTYDSVAYIKNLILELKSIRPDFSILTGLDDHFLNTLILGGDGGIMACANFAPEIHVNLFKAFKEGNYEKAFEYHRKLSQLVRIYEYASSFPSAIKTVLRLMNAPIKDVVRPPLLKEPEEVIKKIEEILKIVGVI